MSDGCRSNLVRRRLIVDSLSIHQAEGFTRRRRPCVVLSGIRSVSNEAGSIEWRGEDSTAIAFTGLDRSVGRNDGLYDGLALDIGRDRGDALFGYL